MAYKELEPSQATYSVADECDLTLLSYIAFLDPPKESAGAAIVALVLQRRPTPPGTRRRPNK